LVKTEEYVKRLNSRNITIQTDAIMDMNGNKRSVGSDGGWYDASDCNADGDEKYDYGEDDGDEEEEDDDDDDVPFASDIPNSMALFSNSPTGRARWKSVEHGQVRVRVGSDDATTPTTIRGRAVDARRPNAEAKP
jgi:hypothetical protein